ncbi:MAG: glutamine--fructose-6-phosphate transaminase (isomerizing) [Thermoplasmata archaeon]|nr:glutamine--fructose-6-phosphate transaminase (isomerizing) [Thermoplasmata archaeon]
MCGIVGYTGESLEAEEILLDALKRLEYRGYDSAGIALIDEGEGVVEVFKRAGSIEELKQGLPPVKSKTGISHTRWATHGVPNDVNAHPHTDCSGKIALVHNGIIENYKALKERLIAEGHQFSSDTDSEIIAHIVEENYHGNLLDAVMKTVEELKGSWAILVIHAEHPGEIVAARHESPLVLGKKFDKVFAASDPTALLKYTDQFIFMEDGQIAHLKDGTIALYDLKGKEVEPIWQRITWSVEDAEKGGFEHYMLKEIYEQPSTIHQCLQGWDEGALSELNIEGTRSITIVACGTSYHAGLVGKYVIETFAGLPVTVETASEYRYSSPKDFSSLHIFISQSGETADTLAALREAKRRGNETLAITNVMGSTITREAHHTLYLRAGPEIGVAATKTFTSQVVILYLLALYIGKRRGKLLSEEVEGTLREIKHLPRAVEAILSKEEEIRNLAEMIKEATSIFYIGRFVNYPSALEGALKMKEISYIHAEGYPAGELKHGPLALLDSSLPVVAILTDDHTYDKMLSNIGEVSARGSPVIAITEEGDREVVKYTEHVLYYPKVMPILSPVPVAIYTQLLAYWTARLRGCEIDKPRNLAKSVTVE